MARTAQFCCLSPGSAELYNRTALYSNSKQLTGVLVLFYLFFSSGFYPHVHLVSAVT